MERPDSPATTFSEATGISTGTEPEKLPTARKFRLRWLSHVGMWIVSGWPEDMDWTNSKHVHAYLRAGDLAECLNRG